MLHPPQRETSLHTLKTFIMEMNCSFKPLGHIIDYELEPCFKMYGLKHGKFDFQGECKSFNFRTAVQIRQQTLDFVKKWDDQLMIRMTPWEFAQLCRMWPDIQQHGKDTYFKFNPEFKKKVPRAKGEDFDVSVCAVEVAGNFHPKLYIGKDSKVLGKFLNISDVELTCTTQEDLLKILASYKDLKARGFPDDEIKKVELGQGNPNYPVQSQAVTKTSHLSFKQRSQQQQQQQSTRPRLTQGPTPDAQGCVWGLNDRSQAFPEGDIPGQLHSLLDDSEDEGVKNDQAALPSEDETPKSHKTPKPTEASQRLRAKGETPRKKSSSIRRRPTNRGVVYETDSESGLGPGEQEEDSDKENMPPKKKRRTARKPITIPDEEEIERSPTPPPETFTKGGQKGKKTQKDSA